MQLNNKLNEYVRFPELEGYYLADVWDMTKHPKYEHMTPELQHYLVRRVHNMHFERCNNLNLREELKYHLYNFIEVRNQELTNMPMRIASLHVFIKYANDNLMNISSILDIEYENFIDNYKEYLNCNGYEPKYLKQKRVMSDMTIKSYKYPSKYEHEVSTFYKSIQEYCLQKVKIQEVLKDKWDIRELPFKVNVPKSRPRYTISFENIHQKLIRDIAKRFVEYRLKANSKYSTCIDDLKGINLLSQFLKDNYPSIKSLEDLNRDIIEDFVSSVKTSDKLAERTQSSRIGSISTFFNICQLNDWDGSPKKTLIMRSDYRHKIKTLPKFFTDDEIQNLNKYIEQLPIQIARMLFVIESVGMRISELSNLEISCLSVNEMGEYSITYLQEKTDAYNNIPILEVVAKTIEEAIRESKLNFGEKTKYVFSKNASHPISVETFSYHLNRLVYFNDIRDRNNKLLRIKSHTFRGTVATKYANLGLNQDVIRMMLGQRTVGSLKHYIEIHNETLLDAMKDIIDIQNEMIKNIGNMAVPQPIDESACLLPLPNGSCNKPKSEGVCLKGNACYSCRMFKGSKEFLHVYEYQLSEAENNILIARMNKWDRIEQNNVDLSESLKRIIQTVTEEVAG